MPAQVPNTGFPAAMCAAMGSNQAGRSQQLALRGAFATWQDHAIDRIVEILGGTQQFPRRAKTIQHGRMLGERALHRQNAGHAVLRGCRACGDVGRLFL